MPTGLFSEAAAGFVSGEERVLVFSSLPVGGYAAPEEREGQEEQE